MGKVMTAVVVIFMLLGMTAQLFAEDPNLSIYEIQYTENEDGSSYCNQQDVNCTGGIVIHKYSKGMQRVFLYDPNHPDCWGGIQVRANLDSPLDDVNVGDWISLENVLVSDPTFNEDDPYKARGNTILFYDSFSSYVVSSRGNELPEPIWVDVNDIAVVYDNVNETCYVTDHRAEKYEAMYIQVRIVAINDVNVGSHLDNYSLEDNNGPNIYCWAADYMNIDNPDDETPHPIVESGLKLCSVSGILEQYTKLSDGWDYYQLLTTKLEDFQVEQIADFDNNCGVDFADFSIFAVHWLQSGCADPDWCGGADLTRDEPSGTVDYNDLLIFSENWLEGKY